jgi:carbohydrate-selective porin OprB
MLGDLWGLRPALAKYGIILGVLETDELLGNATGGTHRGADYDGLTQMVLQMDTQRAFGWYGGLFNVSALQIHDGNPVIPENSYLSLANSAYNDGARILRRSYSYNDGITMIAER